MLLRTCGPGFLPCATTCASASPLPIISTLACSGCSPIPRARSRGSTVMPDLATRAVVSDDGEIRMTLYRDDGQAMAVALAPARAIALAGELIEAAGPKLGLRRDAAVNDKPPNRDDLYRNLAHSLG